MNSEIQNIKQRFEIIGNDHSLNMAIEKSLKVSPTDITVLVMGESGVGKEVFPKIIHQFSHRKHNKYIAVNCGAIPEGTIDSELFGHVKGAFTGATNDRAGYFEVASGGTIFLDEVGELPLSTQVRLLRILESGEFIRVGSSKTQKTDVRIVAATNIKMHEAISKGKFREDLYYRLSTVEINIPPLRKRKDDIILLFRKFASDFAKKYNMPTIRLDEKAENVLKGHVWNGNIRQLKNIAEQLSVLEKNRSIDYNLLSSYLPEPRSNLPALIQESENNKSDFSSEREILYKILFDMKKDLNELKRITNYLKVDEKSPEKLSDFNDLISSKDNFYDKNQNNFRSETVQNHSDKFSYAEEVLEEETLSIQHNEIELIIKALEKSKGKRKIAAKELGISERTLYRKIKQYDIEM
tara:strand:+ start:1438 stop:2667 length:1230 start_codon:yes stop_codon:yes gene_type:complete